MDLLYWKESKQQHKDINQLKKYNSVLSIRIFNVQILAFRHLRQFVLLYL